MLGNLATGHRIKPAHAAINRTLASRIALTIGLSALIFFVIASAARADCVPEVRKVALDKKLNVPLRSYRCKAGTGQDAREIRVEFDRLSDIATSLITSNASSALLRKTFGSMKVVENEVSKTYRDLLKQFGTTHDVVKQQGEISTKLAINAAKQKDEQASDAADTIGPAKLRYFETQGPDYPAATEIAALMKKTIPDGLNYYYAVDSVFCQDQDRIDFVCKKLGKTSVEMVFWKSLSSSDVTNYSKNVQAYNSQLMRVRKDLASAKVDRFSADLPQYFSLMKYLAGESWPEDLMLMTGQHQLNGCGVEGADLPGLAGWTFSASIRAFAMDAMVIENISPQPVSIGSLFGSHSTTNVLRVVKDAPESPSEMVSVGSPSQTVPPGQRLFVPMRLVLLAPADLSDDLKRAEKSLADVRASFGLNGFSGRADALRVPQLNDYAYGPSISIQGLELNSTRVNFEQTPAPNFVALTVTAEAGSCPYLLSRSEDNREWISHGKILHRAPSRDREYTDTAIFSGSRMNFRIEEREPEVAHIENITFAARLQDGTELALQPRLTRAGTPAAYPLDLMWGDAVDVDFALPGHIASDQVVDSRISITGYYERYANLSMGETFSQPGKFETRVEGWAFAPLAPQAGKVCFGRARASTVARQN